MHAETRNSEKKYELLIGMEPMTFRTIVGRSTTEPRGRERGHFIEFLLRSHCGI